MDLKTAVGLNFCPTIPHNRVIIGVSWWPIPTLPLFLWVPDDLGQYAEGTRNINQQCKVLDWSPFTFSQGFSYSWR